MDLEIRFTGVSLLVGLINTPLGENQEYEKAVSNVIDTWKEHKQYSSNQNDEHEYPADPNDFYLPCSFVGFSPFNFITLTLVNEEGLATTLAYQGYSQGQHLYNAQDISLVVSYKYDASQKQLKPANDNLSKIVDALNKLNIPHTQRVDSIPRNVLFPTGEGAERPLFRDKKPISYHDNHGHDLKEVCFHHGEKISLASIYSGKTLSTEQPIVTQKHANELLGLFHLKLSPMLKMRDPRTSKLLVYLALTYLISQEQEKIRKKCPEATPGLIRIFMVDGFFDCLVLMRGMSLFAMEEIARKFKFLTFNDLPDDVIYCLPESKLRQEILEKKHPCYPLLLLSYTVTGVPSKIIEDFYLKFLQKIKDKGFMTQGFNNNISHLILNEYGNFEIYDGKESQNPEYFKVEPHTSLSLKSGRTPQSIKIIKHWKSIISNRTMNAFQDNNNSFSPEKHSFLGRFDARLFLGAKQIPFGQFIVAHQLAKWLLRGPYYYKQDPSLKTLEFLRLRSHLLEMETSFKFPYPPDESGPIEAGEDPANFFNHPGDLRIFSPATIKFILQEVSESKIKNAEFFCTYVDILFKRTTGGGTRVSVQTYKAKLTHYAKLFKDTPNALDPKRLFEAFLRNKFHQSISHETLELIITTILSLESMLTNPLTYYYYLDLRVYALNFLMKLVTAFDINFNNAVYICCYDPNQKSITLIPSPNTGIVGLEAWVTEFLEITHKVIGQRQAGVYPQHDRNFSRLSDIRILHAKKMIGVSWLVARFLEVLLNSFPEVWEHQNSFDKPKLDERTQNIPKNYTQVISYFSNHPDFWISTLNNSISMNARQLTGNERIIQVAHEVGHVFFKLIQIENCTYHKNNVSAGHIETKKIESPQFTAASSREEEYINYLSDSGYKKTIATCLKHDSKVWEEVFCDAFVYKFCFMSWREHFVDFFKNSTGLETEEAFLISWIFQTLNLPPIQRTPKFLHFLTRIAVLYGILKGKDNSEESKKNQANYIWQNHVSNFMKKVLPEYLKTLPCQDEDSEGIQLGKHWNWFIEITLSDHGLNDLNDSNQKTLKQFIDTDLESIFCSYYEWFLDGKEFNSPFFCVVDLFSREGSFDHFFKTPEFKRQDIYTLLAGVLPETWVTFELPEKPASISHFWKALQLAGFVNLAYLSYQKETESPIQVFRGYKGFKDFRFQSYLGVLRRKIGGIIWDGTLHCIREELEKVQKALKADQAKQE